MSPREAVYRSARSLSVLALGFTAGCLIADAWALPLPLNVDPASPCHAQVEACYRGGKVLCVAYALGFHEICFGFSKEQAESMCLENRWASRSMDGSPGTEVVTYSVTPLDPVTGQPIGPAQPVTQIVPSKKCVDQWLWGFSATDAASSALLGLSASVAAQVKAAFPTITEASLTATGGVEWKTEDGKIIRWEAVEGMGRACFRIAWEEFSLCLRRLCNPLDPASPICK